MTVEFPPCVVERREGVGEGRGGDWVRVSFLMASLSYSPSATSVAALSPTGSAQPSTRDSSYCTSYSLNDHSLSRLSPLLQLDRNTRRRYPSQKASKLTKRLARTTHLRLFPSGTSKYLWHLQYPRVQFRVARQKSWRNILQAVLATPLSCHFLLSANNSTVIGFVSKFAFSLVQIAACGSHFPASRP